MGCCETPKYTFRQLLQHWWMLIESQNTPENCGFAPLDPPNKRSVNFFDHHCKFRVFIKIFYVESLFPTCLLWAVWLFEWTQLVFLHEKWTQLVFLAYAKNGFPQKCRRNDVTRPISKCSVLSFGFHDTFSDSLPPSAQKSWSLKCLPATTVDCAGVKRSGLLTMSGTGTLVP